MNVYKLVLLHDCEVFSAEFSLHINNGSSEERFTEPIFPLFACWVAATYEPTF